MRILLALLRLLAGLIALGASTLAILAFLGFAVPILDLLNHLQAIIFPAVVAGIVGIVLLIRDHYIRSFLIAFAATGFIASSTVAVPEIVQSLLPRPAVPTDGRPVIRLVTHNVFGLNYDMERVAEVLTAENPDIIALQEFFPVQRYRLDPLLRDAYPYSARCEGGKRQNIALYSRLPMEFTKDGACFGQSPSPILRTSRIVGRATLEDGTTFSVMTTHLDWPAPIARQQAQMADLVSAVAAVSGPVVVVGDMNSTPWSYALRRMAAEAGLTIQTHNLVTYPLEITAPNRLVGPRGLLRTLPFLPLDQVMTRGDISVHEVYRAPDTGSDHLPIVAVFSVEPMTECCAAGD
jgi:endonuclease/exonuclease/phosphatase (EEP) superfamily protein YafD